MEDEAKIRMVCKGVYVNDKSWRRGIWLGQEKGGAMPMSDCGLEGGEQMVSEEEKEEEEEERNSVGPMMRNIGNLGLGDGVKDLLQGEREAMACAPVALEEDNNVDDDLVNQIDDLEEDDNDFLLNLGLGGVDLDTNGVDEDDNNDDHFLLDDVREEEAISAKMTRKGEMPKTTVMSMKEVDEIDDEIIDESVEDLGFELGFDLDNEELEVDLDEEDADADLDEFDDNEDDPSLDDFVNKEDDIEDYDKFDDCGFTFGDNASY